MRIRTLASLVAGLYLVGLSLQPVAGAVPAGDTLYPASTKAFFSVPDMPKLVGHWEKTQLYQLFEDPVMKPFTEDLRRQLDNKWLSNHDKIGLSIEDLQHVASGELSGAIFETSAGRTGMAVLVDVTDNEAKAREALEKAEANLLKEKAKKSQHTSAGTTIVVYDLPPKEDRQEARRVAYFLSGGLLAGGDGIDVLVDVLARLHGQKKDSLRSFDAFEQVSTRLVTGAGELKPDIRWYIEPIGLAEYRARGDDKRMKNVKMLRNQGFAAIRGVGGFINLAVGEYEILHRTAVYAPKPYEKAMGMLAFPNTAPPSPPTWVPRNVVTFTTLNWEIKTAFERFSTLFDELFGEGSEGTFNDTIDSVREDPNGPHIDIRKDLVGHLGNRAVVLTDYELPITTSSERFAFAVETTNEKALADAVQKSLETDDTVEKRIFHGHVIWEMKGEDDSLAAVVVEHPDDPIGGGDKEDGKRGGRLRNKLGEEEEESVQLPNAAVAVARGHLFISSHVDFLEKVLTDPSEADRLENDADFQRVNEELQKLGATEVCIRNFTRADEQFHITYDLFKAGKLPESETMLAQLIRRVQEDDPDAPVREPKLDGSKLPDYQVARRYLGFGGAYVATEESGWSIVGFLFRKDTSEKSLAAGTEINVK